MFTVPPRYKAGEEERHYVAALVRIERRDDEHATGRTPRKTTPSMRRVDFIFDALLAESFNAGDFAPEIPKSRPLIRLSTTLDKFWRSVGREPRPGDWYLLIAAPRPGGPRLWTAIENQASGTAFVHDESYRLEQIQSLESDDDRSPDSKQLVPSIAGLEHYSLKPSLNRQVYPKGPKRTRKRKPQLHVEAIDVGQASFICIHDGTKSLFYFDVGRPLWFNWKSLPRAVQFYPPHDDAVVIISHWDYDHFSSFIPNPELTTLRWIAPAEGARGANAKKLENILGGRLTKLPYGRGMRIGPLRLTWGTGSAGDFNNRGIIAVVRIGQRRVLLTGDASYAVAPQWSKTGLSGVSIPHHAAASSDSPTPTPNLPAKAVISAGKPNQYGHPSGVVVANHAAWSVLITGKSTTARNAPRGNRLIS